VGGVRARRPVGLLIAAILVVNNVRDIDTDRRAGKRTLAVRLGREAARASCSWRSSRSFASGLVCWFAGPLSPWLALTLLAAPLAIDVARTVCTHADGPSLNVALARRPESSRCVYCLLLCAGVLAS
jgi:1,4-dihydroxy-2-naphthoate octaprenyltransferase